jgi:NADH dehydrogenase/NADH:ubiquinone oxidoreductase subunit G
VKNNEFYGSSKGNGKMKCNNPKCINEAYKVPKGGMCPTWEMAHALQNNLCLSCSYEEVKELRHERDATKTNKDPITRIYDEISILQKKRAERIQAINLEWAEKNPYVQISKKYIDSDYLVSRFDDSIYHKKKLLEMGVSIK